MKLFYILLCHSLLFSQLCISQVKIIDSCLQSAVPLQNTEFVSTSTLANVYNSDVLEWNGTNWFGGYLGANITIAPPANTIGDRVMFVGHSSFWTGGGETFGLKLSGPLVSGQTYSFSITYISHGLFSDGNFRPYIYTNSVPLLGSAALIGTLPSVGTTWTTNVFSFTASASQSGHTWLILGTSPNGTSGLISFGCSNIAVPSCTVNLGNDTTLCHGSSLLLDANTTNGTYLWQDNSTNPTFNVTQQGKHWVRVTVGNCVTTDTINVTYNSTPILNLGNDTTLCQGSSMLLDANTTNGTYLWQDNSTNPNFNVTQQGKYWVRVTVANCITSDTINVTYNSTPIINLGNDTTLCLGSSLLLDANTTNGTYLWQDNSTMSTFIVSGPGLYWVKIRIDNCSSSDTIVISKQLCNIILEIPSLFTPNNDGVNDLFIPIRSEGVVSMKTSIYNRWGDRVAELKNLLIEWNAKNINDGIYYWHIEYEDVNGLVRNSKGIVSIVR